MKKFIKAIITCFIIILSINFINCQAFLDIASGSSENQMMAKVSEKLYDAEYYLYYGDFERARRTYMEIIEWDETNKVNLPDNTIAELYLMIGYLYEMEFEIDKALLNYEIALNLYIKINFVEESFQASFLIARVYDYKLDYDNELKYLNLCLSFYEYNIDKKNIYNVIVQISKVYFNTKGVNSSIGYIDSVIDEETFLYNKKEETSLLSLLSVYYQRKGDYSNFEKTITKINKNLKELKMNRTELDFYIQTDIFSSINKGDYNLALGLMMMMPLTNENYFEILKVIRLVDQESPSNIPIANDYFKNFPQQYAGLFLIEAGYLEAKMVNLESGIKKLSRAIEFFSAKNDKYHIAEAIFSRGKIYFIKGMYEKAIQDFSKCSEIYKGLELKFEYGLSTKYLGLSIFNSNLNNSDDKLNSALSFLNDSTIAFEKLNNMYELAFLYENISYIYNKLSEKNLEIIYLNKAIKAYLEIGNKEKAEELKKRLNNWTPLNIHC